MRKHPTGISAHRWRFRLASIFSSNGAWGGQCLHFPSILLAVIAFSLLSAHAGFEDDFRRWVEHDLWPQAKAAGISRHVFDTAFRNIHPQLRLPDLILNGQTVPRVQRQAEFSVPSAYFKERSIQTLMLKARQLRRRYRNLLIRIERRYGVPAEVILAIWGKESHFGAARLPHDAFRILATQAWKGRRRTMFLRETLAALRIVERGYASRGMMRSSWAGALGQPQMLPSRYLRHAVDFDGDGQRDIWHSVPDVLASIAAHLAHGGWQRGLPWGVEVILPESVSCTLEGPDQGMRLEEWARLGVRRADGRPFPRAFARRTLFLLMPAGRHGPAFLVSKNFYVLKDYNYSDLYALFVGHLADRIAGRTKRAFRTPWRPVGHLMRSDVALMQKALVAAGYDVGGIDGLAGFRTRRAIGLWQRRHGLEPTCFPKAALSDILRRP